MAALYTPPPARICRVRARDLSSDAVNAAAAFYLLGIQVELQALLDHTNEGAAY